LSYWLGEVRLFPDSATDGEAADALRHIGTNAIPILLQRLRTKDSAFEVVFFGFLEKQHFIQIRHSSDWVRHGQAAAGFAVLGASAKDAVPALIEIYKQDVSGWSQVSTVSALGGIGPAARQAVPVLLQGMNSTNQSLRLACIHALGQIHEEPDRVVPALAKSLQDRAMDPRLMAAEALGNFGAEAKAVAPVLVHLLNDPESPMAGYQYQRILNPVPIQITPCQFLDQIIVFVVRVIKGHGVAHDLEIAEVKMGLRFGVILQCPAQNHIPFQQRVSPLLQAPRQNQDRQLLRLQRQS
jgi:hypothetical protein